MKKICTAIVPIHDSEMDFTEIENWIQLTRFSPVKIHLIHDIKNLGGLDKVRELTYESSRESLILTEGYYGSPGFTRNAALEVLDTQWFTFWDSDDLVDIPEFLENIKNLEIEYDAYISNYYLKKGKSNLSKTISKDANLFEEIARDPGIWRIVFNSKYFKEVRFRNFMMGEDQTFLLESNFACARVKHLPNFWYTYVRNGSSQLTKNPNHLSSLSKTVGFNLELLKNGEIFQNNFNLKIISKQIFSNLKSGNLKSIFSTLKSLLKFLMDISPGTRLQFLIALGKEFFINLNRFVYGK